jgi:hypothetical protein
VKEESLNKSRLPVGRRQFVAGGVLGAAGLLIGAANSEAAVDTTGWVTFTSTGPDGASVSYSPTWQLDPSTTLQLSLDPYLFFPYQSFAVRTNAAKPPINLGEDGSGLPDLTGYPTDSAIVWLMYYDQVVEGPSFAGLSLSGLTQQIPEFDGFQSYIARFSNSARSFLLWLWLGTSAPATLVNGINGCVQSIAVPS